MLVNAVRVKFLRDVRIFRYVIPVPIREMNTHFVQLRYRSQLFSKILIISYLIVLIIAIVFI